MCLNIDIMENEKIGNELTRLTICTRIIHWKPNNMKFFQFFSKKTRILENMSDKSFANYIKIRIKHLQYCFQFWSKGSIIVINERVI